MAQAQDTATRLGSTLGPYRLEELIGRTETGDIYRAEDREDGTPWLLKLVHAELCAMPGFRAALRQQAMFLAALEHPHIAQVARIDEDGERCFIAMGWQPDGTLRRLLGRRGSLAEDLPLAVDLAAQIAEGLAFAHEQGFVHGSLSPEDVLLSRRDDGGYTLTISDFGLAWLLLDYGVDSGPWDDSLVYALTPERCRGLEPDARGDQ
ncbi:protein kinase, partial [Oscillochloris sp. ZM17-4]|uniref:protein kinase domain-containing protein n=1 Tax=Oscillochloris sp. ZM17-4 TaxID=2866714 RepID=UPI001C737415